MMAGMTMDTITTDIKAAAAAQGFDVCGIASVQQESDDGFGDWLAAGYHAEMSWLLRTRDVRQHVARLVPDARTVVVLGKYYYRADATPVPGAPRIARYAWSRDYHRALAKPLKRVTAYIAERLPGVQQYASVDSGPVRERAWAARAGVGWIGRNGLVIHPRFGSWLYLAAIITTAPLTPDGPQPNRCGSCRACVEACPTRAITSDRCVDARRCIAYHTVENRGEIPSEIAQRMDGWVFGCDVCQEVCPWNRPERLTDADIIIRSDFACLDAAALAALSDASFHSLFDGTTVKRAKRSGIVRNAALLPGHDAHESP